MAKANTGTTTTKAVFKTCSKKDPAVEETYLRAIPKAARDWFLNEAPTSFGLGAAYKIYRKKGRNALMLAIYGASLRAALADYGPEHPAVEDYTSKIEALQ